MEFHFSMYGVSRRMCYVRVMYVNYVWRMKCTRDVSAAYVLRSILICCVSVLYQMFLITIRTNGCGNSHIIVINSVRPSVRPFVRPSVRQHLRRSLVFSTSEIAASLKPCIVIVPDIPFKHAP